jgi:hypothetical protein
MKVKDTAVKKRILDRFERILRGRWDAIDFQIADPVERLSDGPWDDFRIMGLMRLN